jgi:hypothetical protein
MKYAVEIGSGAMTYISIFIKTGSGIQKVIAGCTDTQTEWRSHKLTSILQIRKVGQKLNNSMN